MLVNSEGFVEKLELGFKSIQIEKIIKYIHETDDFLIPAIQRDVVWDEKDIIKLYDSIYKDYPFGTILILRLNGEADKNITTFYKLNKSSKRQNVLFAGESYELYGDNVKYCLIDGQQRLTALYRGRYLKYINKNKSKRLYFNALYNDSNASYNEDAFKYGDETFLFEENHFWIPIKECLVLDHNDNDFKDKIDNLIEKVLNCIEKKGNIFTFDEMNNKIPRKRSSLYKNYIKTKELIDKNREDISNNIKNLLKKFKEESLLNYNMITFDGLTDEQKMERILDIFTRLNKGGKKLAPSDLLYSQIATYSNEELDVRGKFGEYIEELNKSQTNKINFKLKTFIRFLWLLFGETMSFNAFYVSKAIKKHCTLTKFENAFKALKLAKEIYIESNFKFTDNTAYNMFLPVAYYLYFCDYNKFTSNEQKEIRYEISKFFEVATISRFVSSEHSDSSLISFKKAYNKFNDKDNKLSLFEDKKFNFRKLQDEVNNQISDKSKRFEVTNLDIEKILKYDYDKNKYEIAQVLYLLNKDLVKNQAKIEKDDVDHMHPKCLTDESNYKASLKDLANYNKDDYDYFVSKYNLLPNLQLLIDKANRTEKQGKALDKWLIEFKPNDYLKYMQDNFAIDKDMKVDIKYFRIENFKNFFEKREKIIKEHLENLFGVR